MYDFNKMRYHMKKSLKIVVGGLLIIALAFIVEIAYWTNKPSYTAEDFGIKIIKSKTERFKAYSDNSRTT